MADSETLEKILTEDVVKAAAAISYTNAAGGDATYWVHLSKNMRQKCYLGMGRSVAALKEAVRALEKEGRR
jgi:hypothetical protein